MRTACGAESVFRGQIVSLQSLHYLTLSLLIPPFLSYFADPLSLSVEGGASNVAMVMDWREMAGKGTLDDKIGSWTRLPSSLGRGGPRFGGGNNSTAVENLLDWGDDPARGWVLGSCWFAASLIE
jgi:hypothetical protein